MAGIGIGPTLDAHARAHGHARTAAAMGAAMMPLQSPFARIAQALGSAGITGGGLLHAQAGYLGGADTARGTAGLVIAVTGLLTFLLPWISKELAARRQERRLKRMESAAAREMRQRLREAERELERLRSGDIRTNSAQIGALSGQLEGQLAILRDMGIIAGGPAVRDRAGVPRRPASFLVVEDDPDTQRAFNKLLMTLKFDVRSAANVADALVEVATAPTWIILDIRLGDEDGLDILEYVRANEIPSKVAIITGERDAAAVVAARGVAADHIFLKPVDFDELMAAINPPEPGTGEHVIGRLPA